MAGRTASYFNTIRQFSSSNHGRETPGVSTGDSDWDGRLEFGCSNINQINITRKLGSGVFKTGYLGVYRGRKVVLKMVTNTSQAFTECGKELSDTPGWRIRCSSDPIMYTMKEILLLQQLKHPNFLGLLGFCVRGADVDSWSLQEHGVIAVYEYGDRVNISDMELWLLSRRLDTAIQLLDLAVYAEHSPLGSLRMLDIKYENFIFVGTTIKYSDVDFFTSIEPKCISVDNDSRCSFNLPCIDSRCRGFNAKYNLMWMTRLFLLRLLRSTTVDERNIKQSNDILNTINNGLESVRAELNEPISSNSTDIYQKLIKIRNML